MRVISKAYLKEYNQVIGAKIPALIKGYDFSKTEDNLAYLTKSSAVYSSNIEGNSIDLNSYMNYELNKDKFKAGKEIAEIEDLIKAYEYGQTNALSEAGLLKCHAIFSKTLLIKSNQGKYRVEQVGVFGKSGLAYMAIEPQFVAKEMAQLFSDINTLMTTELTDSEVFYYASLIHLVFAHIHPFRDGNGRAARLLEKWFISEKLGKEFWKIGSEEYYKLNQATYYRTINLGPNYYVLNYDNCMGFLTMLPNCLKVG